MSLSHSLIAWLNDTTVLLSGSPTHQAFLAGFCTLILEDPTSIACGLLVADGKMGFWTAYLGVSLGITVGDLGLYAIGRLVGERIADWGFVSRKSLERTRVVFEDNMIKGIIASRFIPGTRIPMYAGAGIFAAHPVKFLLTALGASLAWTFLLMGLSIKLGELVTSYLAHMKWPIMIGVVTLLILWQWGAARRRKKNELAEERAERPPVVSRFEFWPPYIFYIPVGFYYAFLAARFRSLTLPTISNPSIYSGGMVHESKSQILSLVGKDQRHWVARFTTVKLPHRRRKLEVFQQHVLKILEKEKLSFPLVAKPDVGQRGAGVRPVRTEAELRAYIEKFPLGERLVLQELADFRFEAGVMYYRRPGKNLGHIPSLTLKYFPVVIGDGKSTLRQLILADERAQYLAEVYFKRHRRKLDHVLPAGEEFRLVFSGNHCQGTIFKDGTDQVTPALLSRIHEISVSMPDFYFGRFDIRFHNLETFLKGEDFKIIEVNGASAESTHIWDARVTLKQAYRALFRQFRILFEIGEANRRRGHKPLGAVRMIRDIVNYQKKAKQYPPTA